MYIVQGYNVAGITIFDTISCKISLILTSNTKPNIYDTVQNVLSFYMSGITSEINQYTVIP